MWQDRGLVRARLVDLHVLCCTGRCRREKTQPRLYLKKTDSIEGGPEKREPGSWAVHPKADLLGEK